MYFMRKVQGMQSTFAKNMPFTFGNPGDAFYFSLSLGALKASARPIGGRFFDELCLMQGRKTR